MKNVLTDESCQEGRRDHTTQDPGQTKGYARAGISEFRRETLRGQDGGQPVQEPQSEKDDENMMVAVVAKGMPAKRMKETI